MDSLVTTPPCVILDKPQLPQNIGAVARAMANFGLSDLRMVNPRDGWPQERAWASASGAEWPLNAARIYDSVEAAIADLHMVYATTARPREIRLPVMTPREAMAGLSGQARLGRQVGLLFGGERAGLETADIALCQGIMTLPIDPRFRSLNLAQAVIIVAYEWQMAGQGGAPAPFFPEVEPATQGSMQGLYDHFEAELEAAGFFHPPEKKPSMMQNLRSALSRAQFSDQEVRTFRGVVTALSKGRGRVLEKIASRSARLT